MQASAAPASLAQLLVQPVYGLSRGLPNCCINVAQLRHIPPKLLVSKQSARCSQARQRVPSRQAEDKGSLKLHRRWVCCVQAAQDKLRCCI